MSCSHGWFEYLRDPILFTADLADDTDANPTADRIFNTEFTEGTEQPYGRNQRTKSYHRRGRRVRGESLFSVLDTGPGVCD